MLKRLGAHFFRTRNVLFPILLIGLLAALPPRPFGGAPLDWFAALGVLMVVAGQGLRVLTIGLDYIKRGGKKKRIYADRLVTGGLYAHCRNPMYTGNVLVALGVLTLTGNVWAMLVGAAFVPFMYRAIIAGEEAYLSARFGDQYYAYVRRVPRWAIRMRGLGATTRAFRFDWPGVLVKEYGTLFNSGMIVVLVIGVRAWRSGTLDAGWPWLAGAGGFCVAFFAWARYLKKVRMVRARGRTLREESLAERRRRVDLIDTALLDLLNQRAIEVDAIFAWKRDAGRARLDAPRMAEILDRLAATNPGPLVESDVRRLMGDITEHFARRYEPAGLEPEPVFERGGAGASEARGDALRVHVALSEHASVGATP